MQAVEERASNLETWIEKYIIRTDIRISQADKEFREFKERSKKFDEKMELLKEIVVLQKLIFYLKKNLIT